MDVTYENLSGKDLCSSSCVCRMTIKCECELLMPWFSLDLVPTSCTLFNAHVLTYTRKEAMCLIHVAR